MEYLKVRWHHSHPDEPVLLFSELDAERRETRKVEVFRSGRCGFAEPAEESGNTTLGELTVPPIDDIASNPEFEPVAIARSEFEAVWGRRREIVADVL